MQTEDLISFIPALGFSCIVCIKTAKLTDLRSSQKNSGEKLHDEFDLCAAPYCCLFVISIVYENRLIVL